MARWIRNEKTDSEEKIRIVIMVDPSDPANADVVAFHNSLAWGAGNSTYLDVLRENARPGGKAGRRGAAAAEPLGVAAHASQRKAAQPTAGEVPAATAVPQDTAAKGDLSTKVIVSEKVIDVNDNPLASDPGGVQQGEHLSKEPSSDESASTSRASFSSRAASQFDLADDE